MDRGTDRQINKHIQKQNCLVQVKSLYHTIAELVKTLWWIGFQKFARFKFFTLLYITGMVKVNFSGGEPFLVDRGQYLGQMVQYCKEELQMPSVTIVSNGSLIRESWFQKYGMYINMAQSGR